MSQISSDHIELSGSDFNKLYNCATFYKFMDEKVIVNKNVVIDKNLVNEFYDLYCSFELYFYEESTCHLFWESRADKIAVIKIPDDARVYIEDNKFRANKLITTDIINLENISDTFWINILQKDGRLLEFVKHQTEELCKIAVQQNYIAIQFVQH